MARKTIGRPSRPKFGRRGHVKTGSSGGAGVATTLPATLAVAETDVAFVAPAGGAEKFYLYKIF